MTSHYDPYFVPPVPPADPPHGTIPAGRCANCPHRARRDEVTQCPFCDCPRHVSSPYQGHDPQTPPGSEAALQTFSEQIDEAVKMLRAARDAELAAEDARDKARYKALLSEECPKPGVYDGVRVTAAYQQAWVAREITEEESAYKAAKVVRQAAQDHLSKLNGQKSIAQTIANSVAGSYQGTGRDSW